MDYGRTLKTTLNYHKAEKTKNSLLGLSGCNSLPSNPNKLSSWACKQAALVINVIYSNFYTRCSGTTLNEYHDITSVLSDGTQSVQSDVLTKSTPNSTECGYKPTIALSCSVNGINLTINASQPVKDNLLIEIYGYDNNQSVQQVSVSLNTGESYKTVSLSFFFDPSNPPSIEYVNASGMSPLETPNAKYSWY